MVSASTAFALLLLVSLSAYGSLSSAIEGIAVYRSLCGATSWSFFGRPDNWSVLATWQLLRILMQHAPGSDSVQCC